MNTDAAAARTLAKDVAAGLPDGDYDVILCPPAVYLTAVGRVAADSRIELGGQNCYSTTSGAYTGEISPDMLKDIGAEYCIIGHSERRHTIAHGEDDWLINQKIHASLAAKLRPIFCIGETLEQREAGKTNDVLSFQVAAGLSSITLDEVAQVVIAYEPVWAIGTGKVATPEQAQDAHKHIRNVLRERFPNQAEQTAILYGGSVKPGNAAGLMEQPDIDGGLIGGASLKADDFIAIINATLAVKQ